jgi:PIN domain nuclease of toxin-antitoxin system
VKKTTYLFDTHALIFWNNKETVSEDFIKFFDKQDRQGYLYVSSISFWEVAFLVKRNRLTISDVHVWKKEILQNTSIHLIDPSASEMINSVLLPEIHKDPFDRLLISQANHNNFILVTRDQNIQKYEVETFWIK